MVSGLLSVRLSARTVPVRLPLAVKFSIGDLYKNLSRNSKFGSNRVGISGALREDLNTFIVAGDIKVTKRSFDLNGIRLLG
jgi:hypothetical protein